MQVLAEPLALLGLDLHGVPGRSLLAEAEEFPTPFPLSRAFWLKHIDMDFTEAAFSTQRKEHSHMLITS